MNLSTTLTSKIALALMQMPRLTLICELQKCATSKCFQRKKAFNELNEYDNILSPMKTCAHKLMTSSDARSTFIQRATGIYSGTFSFIFGAPISGKHTLIFLVTKKKITKNVDLTGHKTMAEVRLSKFMAMLLRHDAKARGLTVSPGTCNY